MPDSDDKNKIDRRINRVVSKTRRQGTLPKQKRIKMESGGDHDISWLREPKRAHNDDDDCDGEDDRFF